jgi:hypothetical protein
MSGLDKYGAGGAGLTRIMADDMCPGCGSALLSGPDGKVCLTCVGAKSGTEQGEPAWDELRRQASEGASEILAEQNNREQLRLDPPPPPGVEEDEDKVLVPRPEQQPKNKFPSRFDYERMLVETPPPVEQVVEESEPVAASSTAAPVELAGPATDHDHDHDHDHDPAVELAGLRRLVPSIRKHLLDAYEEMSQIGIIAEQLQIKLEAKSETDLEKKP